MSADFSSGTNSSLTPSLARNDKQHSNELFVSGEYEKHMWSRLMGEHARTAIKVAFCRAVLVLWGTPAWSWEQNWHKYDLVMLQEVCSQLQQGMSSRWQQFCLAYLKLLFKAILGDEPLGWCHDAGVADEQRQRQATRIEAACKGSDTVQGG